MIIAKPRYGWHVFGKSQRLIRCKFGCTTVSNYVKINVAIADYNAVDFQEIPKKDFPRFFGYIYITSKILCKYNSDRYVIEMALDHI